MPIRFPTEAANADILGEDADDQKSAGADGTPRGRPKGAPEHFQRSDRARASRGESPGAEAKPGLDINQAGFMKDQDAGKP
jgi:hypothetical protein